MRWRMKKVENLQVYHGYAKIVRTCDNTITVACEGDSSDVFTVIGGNRNHTLLNVGTNLTHRVREDDFVFPIYGDTSDKAIVESIVILKLSSVWIVNKDLSLVSCSNNSLFPKSNFPSLHCALTTIYLDCTLCSSFQTSRWHLSKSESSPCWRIQGCCHHD